MIEEGSYLKVHGVKQPGTSVSSRLERGELEVTSIHTDGAHWRVRHVDQQRRCSKANRVFE